eukprot:2268122-Amphidinium_carterae.1
MGGIRDCIGGSCGMLSQQPGLFAVLLPWKVGRVWIFRRSPQLLESRGFTTYQNGSKTAPQ